MNNVTGAWYSRNRIVLISIMAQKIVSAIHNYFSCRHTPICTLEVILFKSQLSEDVSGEYTAAEKWPHGRPGLRSRWPDHVGCGLL